MGCLWIDVRKCDDLSILVKDLARDLAVGDLAEQTVLHSCLPQAKSGPGLSGSTVQAEEQARSQPGSSRLLLRGWLALGGVRYRFAASRASALPRERDGLGSGRGDHHSTCRQGWHRLLIVPGL